MHSWSAYITSKLRTLQEQKMVVGFQLPPFYFLLTYHFLILSSPSCSTLEKLILLFPYKNKISFSKVEQLGGERILLYLHSKIV